MREGGREGARGADRNSLLPSPPNRLTGGGLCTPAEFSLNTVYRSTGALGSAVPPPDGEAGSLASTSRSLQRRAMRVCDEGSVCSVWIASGAREEDDAEGEGADEVESR